MTTRSPAASAARGNLTALEGALAGMDSVAPRVGYGPADGAPGDAADNMADDAPASRYATGGRTAVRRWLRRRDVGVAYAVVVLVIGVYVHTRPGRQADLLILDSSTNLANLREAPLSVLAVSAFVVSSLRGLWVLPLLVVGFGEAQRWLGRTAAVVAGVLGHVGATLLVATLLVAGVRHGRLDPSVARAPDVGVSYGLFAVAGLLSVRVPRGRWRWGYVTWLIGWTTTLLLWRATFTDVGHTVALLIGFGLAALAAGAARSAVRPRTPPGPKDRARPAAGPPVAIPDPPRSTP